MKLVSVLTGMVITTASLAPASAKELPKLAVLELAAKGGFENSMWRLAVMNAQSKAPGASLAKSYTWAAVIEGHGGGQFAGQAAKLRAALDKRLTEAQRRAAEEDHARIVRDIRIRLDPARVPETEVLVDETAPHPESPDVTAFPSGAGPPPWRFWFGEEVAEEGRAPDRVVADVRGAVIDVLEADQQLRRVLRIHDLADLVADLLDVRLIENVAVNELDAHHAVLVGDTDAGGG